MRTPRGALRRGRKLPDGSLDSGATCASARGRTLIGSQTESGWTPLSIDSPPKKKKKKGGGGGSSSFAPNFHADIRRLSSLSSAFFDDSEVSFEALFLCLSEETIRKYEGACATFYSNLPFFLHNCFPCVGRSKRVAIRLRANCRTDWFLLVILFSLQKPMAKGRGSFDSLKLRRIEELRKTFL